MTSCCDHLITLFVRSHLASKEAQKAFVLQAVAQTQNTPLESWSRKATTGRLWALFGLRRSVRVLGVDYVSSM